MLDLALKFVSLLFVYRNLFQVEQDLVLVIDFHDLEVLIAIKYQIYSM